MLSQTSILVYGRDAQLLETRRRVLELSGAHVWMATDISDIVQLGPAVRIDLIVLCHSLSTEQCDQALALAQSRWPQVQTLVLIAGERGCHTGGSDHMADVSRGPAYLLNTVAKLLRQEHAIDSRFISESRKGNVHATARKETVK